MNTQTTTNEASPSRSLLPLFSTMGVVVMLLHVLIALFPLGETVQFSFTDSKEPLRFQWAQYFLANLGFAAFFALIAWRRSRDTGWIPTISLARALTYVLPVFYLLCLATGAAESLFRMWRHHS